MIISFFPIFYIFSSDICTRLCVFFIYFRYFFFSHLCGSVRCLNLSHFRLNFLLWNFWNVYCFLTASNYFFNMKIFTSFYHNSKKTNTHSRALADREREAKRLCIRNIEKKTITQIQHYPQNVVCSHGLIFVLISHIKHKYAHTRTHPHKYIEGVDLVGSVCGAHTFKG